MLWSLRTDSLAHFSNRLISEQAEVPKNLRRHPNRSVPKTINGQVASLEPKVKKISREDRASGRVFLEARRKQQVLEENEGDLRRIVGA